MKIAVPTADGKLCMHFGHCETFSLLDVDPESKSVIGEETVVPPPHEPGVLPRWLHEKGVSMIIAGGMGMRAQQLFQQFQIEVVVGAPAGEPKALAESRLRGELVTGGNVCDH